MVIDARMADGNRLRLRWKLDGSMALCYLCTEMYASGPKECTVEMAIVKPETLNRFLADRPKGEVKRCRPTVH